MTEGRNLGEKFAVVGYVYKRSNGERIPDDEPVFLLRARDHLALATLVDYRRRSLVDGCNDYHFEHLDKDIEAFQRFALEHPERMKQPSVTRGIPFTQAPACADCGMVMRLFPNGQVWYCGNCGSTTFDSRVELNEAREPVAIITPDGKRLPVPPV